LHAAMVAKIRRLVTCSLSSVESIGLLRLVEFSCC
jgi:hypothetical protein